MRSPFVNPRSGKKGLSGLDIETSWRPTRISRRLRPPGSAKPAVKGGLANAGREFRGEPANAACTGRAHPPCPRRGIWIRPFPGRLAEKEGFEPSRQGFPHLTPLARGKPCFPREPPSSSLRSCDSRFASHRAKPGFGGIRRRIAIGLLYGLAEKEGFEPSRQGFPHLT